MEEKQQTQQDANEQAKEVVSVKEKEKTAIDTEKGSSEKEKDVAVKEKEKTAADAEKETSGEEKEAAMKEKTVLEA